MYYDDFLRNTKDYTGRGIQVTCPYADENYACEISIIGLEDGGGIQSMTIMNKNNICVTQFLPDVWYPKIDPKDFKLNSKDIEILNEFELCIMVEKGSVIKYLNSENGFIRIFLFFNNDPVPNFEAIKAEKFNEFLDRFSSYSDKEFKNKGKMNLDRYFNSDVDPSSFE